MFHNLLKTLPILLFALPIACFGQIPIGFGASAGYNFQTESIGFGLRAEAFVLRDLSVLIDGFYTPSFNPVHEVNGGLELHYAPLYHPVVRPYALAGGSVNYWFDFQESNYNKAKPLNFIAEVGGGLVFFENKWRPFAEFRYNPIWLEGAVRVGVMFFPNFGRGGKYDCPAYQ